jgi:metallophosphoesterase superfamily enzyme
MGAVTLKKAITGTFQILTAINTDMKEVTRKGYFICCCVQVENNTEVVIIAHDHPSISFRGT